MKIFKNFKILILTFMCGVLSLGLGFSCISLSLKASSQSEATNIASTSTYVNVGDIVNSNYDDGPKVFNPNNLNALYKAVTGKTNATLADVDALVSAASVRCSSSTLKLSDGSAMTGGPIVDAKTLNAKAGGKDIVLTFGGYDWTVTSLTKSKSGDVVATIWLANITKNKVKIAPFNNWTSDTKGTQFSANTYGTSYMNTFVLNNGGYCATGSTNLTQINPSEDNEWAKFTMPNVNGSLTDYILAPVNIGYQASESWPDVCSAADWQEGNAYYDTPNHTNGISGGGNKNYTGNYWNSWKDSKIWLPSLTEVGRTNGIPTENTLWKVTNNQVADSSSTAHIWLRADAVNNYSVVCTLLPRNGQQSGLASNFTNAVVRPAMHLNLTAAERDSGTNVEVEDVTVEYSGKKQSLSAVADWFDSNIMEFDDSSAGGLIDVGEYTVNVTLTDSKTAFAGKDASLREMNAKIIVEPKKLALNITTGSDGYLQASAKNISDIYIGDTTDNGRAPVFVFDYKSSDGKGYNFVHPNLPNKVGSYIGTAKIENQCNYVIDTTKAYTASYVKGKTQITRPYIDETEKTYNGEILEFPIFGASYGEIRIVPLTSGLDYDQTTNTLKAKNAGKYQARVALFDEDEQQWKNTGTTESFVLEFEILKRNLNLEFGIQSYDEWSWKIGERPTITIKGDSLPNDRTELYIYYIDRKNPTEKKDRINQEKEFSDDFKTRIIVMPIIEAGSYEIGVEMIGEAYQNNNYKLASSSGIAKQSFTVRGNSVVMAEPQWLCNGEVIVDISDAKFVYQENPFEISINETLLTANGWELDTSKGTNGFVGDISVNKFGTYSVTVYLKSLPGFEEQTAHYTLTYMIEKAKYDLSNLLWDYSEANKRYFKKDTKQNVKLAGSMPNGLKASYIGSKDMIPVGENYKTIVQFSNSNPNYYDPISSDSSTYIDNVDNPFAWECVWAIEKAVLVASWNFGNEDAENILIIPSLKPFEDLSVNDMVDYTFYEITNDGSEIQVSLEDIDGYATNLKTYKIVASLKPVYQENYVLNPTEPNCMFEVGGNKYVIQLQVKFDGEGIKESYEYTGQAPKYEIDFVKNPISLTQEDIIITYYKDGSTEGTTEIPTEIGSYLAVITVRKEVDTAVIDENCDSFTFSIVKAKVAGSWNNDKGYGVFSPDKNGHSDVVTIKYFKEDAESGELTEVSVEEMIEGESYKAVVEIADADHYEFDENTELEYEFVFEKKSNFFADVWDFVKKNWIWFAIGLGILLLLIILIIIIIIVKRRKKDDDEEQPEEQKANEETLEEDKKEQEPENEEAKEEVVVEDDNLDNNQTQTTFNSANSNQNFANQGYNQGFANNGFANNSTSNFAPPPIQNAAPAQAQQVIVESAEASKLRFMIEQLQRERDRKLHQGFMDTGMYYTHLSSHMMNELKMKEELLREEYRKEAMRLEEMIEERKQEALRDERRREERREEELREERLREQRHYEDMQEERRREERRQEALREERLREEHRREEERREERKREEERQEELYEDRRREKRQREFQQEILEESLSDFAQTKPESVQPEQVAVVQPEVVEDVEPQTVATPVVDEPKENREFPQGAIIINSSPKLELDEAYENLPTKQKQYFRKLKEYADKKPNATSKESKKYLIVGEGNKPYIKLMIKRNMTVAYFKLENENLKALRRSGNGDVEIKVKETELKIVDDNAFEMAKNMIDLRVQQIAQEKEYLKQLRKEKRRQNAGNKK